MQHDLSNIHSHKESNHELSQRTVKAVFWVFALRILMQILSYARYIILLRILPVVDIGLLGVATLLMQTLNTFTNTGFQAAIIQKKEKVQDYLDSAWTIGIIRAIVLFVILYLVAPYAAMLGVPDEKVPLTIDIIRVTGQYLGIYFIIKCTKAGVWEMLKPMLFPLAVTIVMLAVMATLKNKLPESITFAPFFVLAIIGTATYTAAVLVCDKFFGYGIVRNIREKLKTSTK